MKPLHSGGTRFVIAAAAALLLVALPQTAQAKKLQVIQASADIHLNADPSSPVIETLVRGATMTLASAIKTRTRWYYVYFTSAQTGKTRSGYIIDDMVRKLYPDLKIVQITDENDAAVPEALDFNDAYRPVMDWGSSKNTVFEAEGRPLGQEKIEGVEIVTYKRHVMGRRCLVEYVFDDDRLAVTRLSLLEQFADKNRYIEDYLKLKDYTASKIGAPAADQVVWQDPTLKGEEALWGRAVSSGQLEFQARWDMPGTEIRMKLVGGNNEVAFGAEFTDNGLKSASF